MPKGRKIWSDAFLLLDIMFLKADERVYVETSKGKVMSALPINS